MVLRKLKSASVGEVITICNSVNLISSIRSFRVSFTSNWDSEFVSMSGVSISKGKLIPVAPGTTTLLLYSMSNLVSSSTLSQLLIMKKMVKIRIIVRISEVLGFMCTSITLIKLKYLILGRGKEYNQLLDFEFLEGPKTF